MKLHQQLFRAVAGLVLLASPALATNPPPSQTVTAPAGATSYTVEVRDSDVFSDDTLQTTTVQVPGGTQAGQTVTVNYDKLKCVGHIVHGPAGSSGERCAEIFARVTFHFPSGSTVTIDTKVQEMCCPAPEFELPPGFYAGPKY